MNKNMMGWMHMLAFVLVIVGALNWGLVGLLNFNLVEMLFGVSSLTSLVYVLVGVSALYLVLTHKDDCMCCDRMMSTKKKGKK